METITPSDESSYNVFKACRHFYFLFYFCFHKSKSQIYTFNEEDRHFNDVINARLEISPKSFSGERSLDFNTCIFPDATDDIKKYILVKLEFLRQYMKMDLDAIKKLPHLGVTRPINIFDPLGRNEWLFVPDGFMMAYLTFAQLASEEQQYPVGIDVYNLAVMMTFPPKDAFREIFSGNLPDRIFATSSEAVLYSMKHYWFLDHNTKDYMKFEDYYSMSIAERKRDVEEFFNSQRCADRGCILALLHLPLSLLLK